MLFSLSKTSMAMAVPAVPPDMREIA